MVGRQVQGVSLCLASLARKGRIRKASKGRREGLGYNECHCVWLTRKTAHRVQTQLEFKVSSSRQGEDLEEQGKDSNIRME